MTVKSRGRWVWAGLVLLSLLAGALSSGGGATAQTLSTAERVDAGVLNALAEGGRSDFIIEMSEQADLSAAYGMTDWDARGQYVVDTLKATAERTQAPVAAALQKRGADFTSFFAGNLIYVRNGDQGILEDALAQKGVGRVRAPVTAYITPAANRLEALGPQPQELNATYTSWGLIDTGATTFWELFPENKGTGMVIANIDTGVDFANPALLPNYHCQDDPNSPACWYDPTGACLLINDDGTPCDDHGHGTHTMGTMAADNDPSFAWIVGMAPDAEWIACKACDQDRSCDGYNLLACGDWILSAHPNVVNNSWAPSYNPDLPVLWDTWYINVVEDWSAAGIFPVFSAGNDGYYGCGTILSPANYRESFAVAAHQEPELDGKRYIWPDSSRGPGFLPGVKPNLSAPGQYIMSTVPVDPLDPDYFFGTNTGTSMAAPHVGGAVALLWSLYPDLRGNVSATFDWLQNSADTPLYSDVCGLPGVEGANYVFGYGYLNVLGEDEGDLGAVKGTITDDFNGLPLADATISADNGAGGIYQATSDSTGFYTLMAPEGTYQLTAVKAGYLPSDAVEVTIELRKPAKTVDFVLAGERTWIPLISK